MQDLTKVEKKEKTMTTKEICEATQAPKQTVIDIVNRIFPGKMSHGKTTLFNEVEVAEISKELKRAHNCTSNRTVATTDLEMHEMTLKVLQYHVQKVSELQEENDNLVEENTQLKLTNEELSHKSNFYDDFMYYGSNNIKIGDLAKTFNLIPSQLFTYMRDNKIIMRSGHGYSVFSRYMTQSYFVQKSKLTEKGNKTVVLVTPKGCAWLYKKLKESGIL